MERPHKVTDQVRAWEAKADAALVDNEAVMGADGLGLDAKSLEELVWHGLKESTEGEHAWRSLSAAEQLYYTWLHKKRGEPDGICEPTGT